MDGAPNITCAFTGHIYRFFTLFDKEDYFTKLTVIQHITHWSRENLHIEFERFVLLHSKFNLLIFLLLFYWFIQI